KRRMALERLATAYHEAGHAVVTVYLGHALRYVTIIPEGDTSGHALCPFPKGFNLEQLDLLDRRTLNRAQDNIVILMAGGAAEARLRGHRNRIGASGDAYDMMR